MLDGSAEVRILSSRCSNSKGRIKDDTTRVKYLTHKVLLVRSNLGKKFSEMEVRHILNGNAQICLEDLNSFICCTY